MKNTKYQKIIMLAIVGLLIYPSITFASWWNPFSWFKKTPTATMVQSINPTAVIKNTESKIVSSTPKENKNIAVNKKIKSYVQVPSIPTLSINELITSSTDTTATIGWNTSIPTNDKVFLQINGVKTQVATSSLSTIHSATLTNLSPSNSYFFTVESIASDGITNTQYNGTFTTATSPKPDSLKITLKNSTCLSTSCQINWQTNYPTDSTITITKADTFPQLFHSENGISANHAKNLTNLSPNTTYSFTINATYYDTAYGSESAEIEGSFTTKSSPITPPTPSNMINGQCYVPSSGGIQVQVPCLRNNGIQNASA